MINQEDIYKLLQEENWKSLIDIFHKKKDFIKTDTLLQQSFETTLNVITQKAIELYENSDFIDNLESVLLLKSGKFIILNADQEEAITLAIINGKRHDLSYCYQYAKKYPENSTCKEIIRNYEKELPKAVEHSQIERLIITENSTYEQADFRKPLFNSIQEIEFYLALKRVFSTYQIYPNVGLSCVLEFDNLKSGLSQREIDFFLRSSVDFVVFEPFNNYYPVYFFEIDSVWHDSDEQKEKDKIKDKIFTISGQKLYRIRKINGSIGENEFEALLTEIRDKISN